MSTKNTSFLTNETTEVWNNGTIHMPDEQSVFEKDISLQKLDGAADNKGRMIY